MLPEKHRQEKLAVTFCVSILLFNPLNTEVVNVIVFLNVMINIMYLFKTNPIYFLNAFIKNISKNGSNTLLGSAALSIRLTRLKPRGPPRAGAHQEQGPTKSRGPPRAGAHQEQGPAKSRGPPRAGARQQHGPTKSRGPPRAGARQKQGPANARTHATL